MKPRPLRATVTSAMALIVFGLLSATACAERGPSPEVQEQLDQLESIRAENDRLFSEVAANARLMSEISAELDEVGGLAEVAIDAGESPMEAAHRRVVSKVSQVTDRLANSERQLADTRRRLGAVSAETDSLRSRVETLTQSVRDFETVIASQRSMLEELNHQIEVLESVNVALQDSMTTLVDEQNTAYYVIGTKDELLERGIVVKEGGARFLFVFGRRGQTLQPARELDPAAFTQIDIRDVTAIPLPDEAEYTIASRQDLDYLGTPTDGRGRITGSIQITEPREFWMTSKFLIVVRS